MRELAHRGRPLPYSTLNSCLIFISISQFVVVYFYLIIVCLYENCNDYYGDNKRLNIWDTKLKRVFIILPFMRFWNVIKPKDKKMVTLINIFM